MGIHDRDYMQDRTAPTSSFGLGGMRMWSVATWIIAVNVAVFVIDALLAGSGLAYGHLLGRGAEGGLAEAWPPLRQAVEIARARPDVTLINAYQPIERWGYFSFTTSVAGLQLWRWISFQFLHANLGHLLGNMLGIYFFGAMIEDYLGRRRFLAFYLLCGVAGPVLYLLFALAGVLNTLPQTPLIGASAGVFGILVAASRVAPDARVMLLFPPIPMKLRTMALALLGIAAFTVFSQGRNAGGEAAHLGGAALGFLLITRPGLLNWAEKAVPRKILPGGGRRGGGTQMKYHGWRGDSDG